MKKGTKVAVIGRGPGTIVDIFDEQHQYAVKLANGKIEFVPFTFVQSMKDRSSDTKKIQEMANIKPKLIVDVNHNPTKKGIKVQFALPQTLSGDAKAEAAQKLQAKLNQGLEQYNLTVSQDTDVPYSNVIGFLIPIADVKLLIKKALGMGESTEPAPEEMPAPEAAPEEPVAEMKRMQELAGLFNENDSLDWNRGVHMEIKSKLTPELQKKVLKTIKKEVFIDCRFDVEDNKLYLFIPYAGDWENVRDVLDSLGVKRVK
jgi:hypothetical protein